MEQVLDHAWFADIDREQLIAKTIKPTFLPSLTANAEVVQELSDETSIHGSTWGELKSILMNGSVVLDP